MANGKIRFGKQSGGQLALVMPDGVTNTEVTFPESGVLATAESVLTATKDVYVVDDNYIDLDAIGANPTAKLYSDGTIVGSTDNGSYVKYPNGELEYKGVPNDVIHVTRGEGAQNKIFSVSFVSLPSISVTSGSSLWTGYYNNLTINSVYIGMWKRDTTGTGTVNATYTAKGKWK